MANIRIDLNHAPLDGETVAFKAPCNASEITGLIIYYTNENSESVSSEFTLNDANGGDIGLVDNIFSEGAIVKVILDTDTNNAYVQNSDTNTYLETKFADIEETVKEYTDNAISNLGNTYYTETEIDEKIVDINELIAGKSDSGHKHDTDYDAIGSANIALEEAKTYTDTKTADLTSITDVDNKISTHNTSESAHGDIRVLISDLKTELSNFLDVDDETVDQLSEVLAMIDANEGTLESLTSSKVNVSDIIDNLTTSSASKVLSASQGVAIKTLIDALQAEKADIDHRHDVATGSTDGFMSSVDKIKLDNLSENPVAIQSTPPINGDVWIDTSEDGETITPASIGAPTIEEMEAAIAAIPEPENNVFIAEYGVTTCAELEVAWQAGKTIVTSAYNGVMFYNLTQREAPTKWCFAMLMNYMGYSYPVLATCINDVWSEIYNAPMWVDKVQCNSLILQDDMGSNMELKHQSGRVAIKAGEVESYFATIDDISEAIESAFANIASVEEGGF